MPSPTLKSTAAALLTAGFILQASATFADQPAPLHIPVIANSGAEIGSATLSGGPKGVILRLTINPGALTPGWHGMHFHAVGDCSDSAKFMNSKAHINHNGAKHGLLNPNGPEDGDLPNLYVAADGSASAEIASELVTMTGGDHALLDADGSALIIHAAEDDHTSQPIGNSGARVACAQIK